MHNQIYSAYPDETKDLFTEEPVVYASFWERFLAAFIDGLILTIPNLFFRQVIGRPGIILSITIAWLYHAIQESGNKQATIGKRAMSLNVTDTDRQRINFGQATVRHFGKIISTIILFIGYFMMLWDDRKQTLHDKMANALVIKK
jgi:uncharacterized RDD family membrane protein YckC